MRKPLWSKYYHYIGVWSNRSDKFEFNKTNKYLKIKRQHKQCKKEIEKQIKAELDKIKRKHLDSADEIFSDFNKE